MPTAKVKMLTIEHFCKEVKNNHKTLIQHISSFDYVNDEIHELAELFIDFFELQHPLQLTQLIDICCESNYEIDTYSIKQKSRGWNFSYKDKVKILYYENDSPCGQMNTVLHELFEIFSQKLFADLFKKKKFKKIIEKNAEIFSGYILAPQGKVINWINENGFDVFGLKNYFNCSYVSAVIRLNESLCHTTNKQTGLPTPLIMLLFERPYWKQKPGGNTPKLQLRSYTKSKGFPFTLRKSDLSQLILDGNIPVKDLRKSKENRYYHNIRMEFNDKKMSIDILIRIANWKAFKNNAKVLIQIVPSDVSYLSSLAEQLGIG